MYFENQEERYSQGSGIYWQNIYLLYASYEYIVKDYQCSRIKVGIDDNISDYYMKNLKSW